MSTSDTDTNTKLNDLCDDLKSCKLGKISDEELFKQPPPAEDCPICFQRLPSLSSTGSKYFSCCGKVICSGCVHSPLYDNQGNEVDNKKCPFCRSPHPESIEELVKRDKKRVELNDPIAMHNQGYYYSGGDYGIPQDYGKALELWHRAAELGYARAYSSIGSAYAFGRGVDVDEKKAKHYYELAAMGGEVAARRNLGNNEARLGNMERALKHYMIAAVSGHTPSLKQIKWLYTNGHATKEDYTKVLRAYQEYLGEIKSAQRDKAAAFDSEKYQYYE